MSNHLCKGNLGDFITPAKAPFLKLRLKNFCLRGREKNLIMITGKTGSGKSLLAACLEGEMKQNGKRAITITCETLTDRIVYSIRNKHEKDWFANELARYDLVMFDEMEELRGRNSTQLEVTFLIEKLLRRGTKVVLFGSEDRTAYEDLLNILKKIRTPVKVFSLPCLGIHQRCWYAAKMAKKYNLNVSSKEIRKIAGISDNMRDVAGMVHTVAALSGGKKVQE